MIKQARNLFSRLRRPADQTDIAESGPVLSAAPQRTFERVVIATPEGHAGSLPDGIAMASAEIEAVSDLPKFARTLLKGVRRESQEAICPIQIVSDDEQGKRLFAVVMLQRMVHTDIAEEVVAALSKEYQAASPCIYVATQNVLSELARSENDPEASRKIKATRNSTLWTHFEDAVKFATEIGVSDLHFKLRLDREYSQIGFRVDGRVIKPRRFRMQTKMMLSMMSYLYGFHGNSTTTNYFSPNEALQCQLEETIGGKRLGFRWGQLPTHNGVKIVLRIIQLDSGDAFTSLGRAKGGAGYTAHQVEIWERNIYSAGGGTLIAGVVNSGKSKTMQAVLGLFPRDYEINTAEDPIEYIVEDANHHSTSRSMNDEESIDPFNAFKMQNKRMDPDVTMIGELRDTKTASAFRDSVLAGQRVFASIHAPDALAIWERLVSEEFGLTRDVISLPSFLKLLVYQALVPKTCERCKLEATAYSTAKFLKGLAGKPGLDPEMAPLVAAALRASSPASLNRIERLFGFDPSRMRLRNPAGCAHCVRDGVPELNGVRGRLLVAQMVEPTLEMLSMVRDAKNIELYQLYRSLRTAPFDSENSDGKTPLQVAMFNVAAGELCPTEVEKKFQTFDAYAAQLSQYARSSTRPDAASSHRPRVQARTDHPAAEILIAETLGS